MLKGVLKQFTEPIMQGVVLIALLLKHPAQSTFIYEGVLVYGFELPKINII